MKMPISLCLLVLTLLVSSCSKTAGVNNAAKNVVKDANTTEKQQPSNSEDEVPIPRMNQAKASGWQVPPPNRDVVRKSVADMQTTTGKQVKVTSTDYSYAYENPWSYSEDFRDLRGPVKLESVFFSEYSGKGRVFMYSIMAKEVRAPPVSNRVPHEDSFVYKIMDADGDGIFETLLGDYDEIIVPNWVVK